MSLFSKPKYESDITVERRPFLWKITDDESLEPVTRLPPICLTHFALEKMYAYIDLYPHEISGLGMVESLEDGTQCVTDIILPRQNGNTGAHTDFTEHQAELMMELDALGVDMGKLRFWWHSHVNMAVNWSAIDDRTARGFGADYMISVVANKRHQLRCRIDVKKPLPMTIDNVRVDVLIVPGDNMTLVCLDEIRNKVKPLPTQFLVAARKFERELAIRQQEQAAAVADQIPAPVPVAENATTPRKEDNEERIFGDSDEFGPYKL